MATENTLQFLRGIASRRPVPPVTLVAGPQATLRELAVEAIRQRLGSKYSYRSFQVSAAADASALMSEMREADLFAPLRLIVCRFSRPQRQASGGASEEESGESGKSPSPERALAQAVGDFRGPGHLVLVYERGSAPARVRQAVERVGVAVNCLKPFDSQLAQYAEVFARLHGVELAPKAAEVLVSLHGSDPAALFNAIDKAALFAEGGKLSSVKAEAPGLARPPEMFELADSLARGSLSKALMLLERATLSGRDPLEILAVEIAPVVRRMLVAAVMLEGGAGNADVASVLGGPPSGFIASQAIEGARRIGADRLRRAHRRIAELDDGIKRGIIRERVEALSALLFELQA